MKNKDLEVEVKDLKAEKSRMLKNASLALASLKAYIDTADTITPSVSAAELNLSKYFIRQDADGVTSDEDANIKSARTPVTQASNGLEDGGSPCLASSPGLTPPGIMSPTLTTASSSFAGLTPSTAATRGALSNGSSNGYCNSIRYGEDEEFEGEQGYLSDTDLDEYQKENIEVEVKPEGKSTGHERSSGPPQQVETGIPPITNLSNAEEITDTRDPTMGLKVPAAMRSMANPAHVAVEGPSQNPGT